MSERELSDAECEKLARKTWDAHFTVSTHSSVTPYDIALIRAGWQARAGAIAPPLAVALLHEALTDPRAAHISGYLLARAILEKLAAPIAQPADRNQAGAASSGAGLVAPAQGEFAEYPAIAQPVEPPVAQKYAELLYAVATKHPGETRHETALRYICQAENRPCEAQGEIRRPGR